MVVKSEFFCNLASSFFGLPQDLTLSTSAASVAENRKQWSGVYPSVFLVVLSFSNVNAGLMWLVYFLAL